MTKFFINQNIVCSYGGWCNIEHRVYIVTRKRIKLTYLLYKLGNGYEVLYVKLRFKVLYFSLVSVFYSYIQWYTVFIGISANPNNRPWALGSETKSIWNVSARERLFQSIRYLIKYKTIKGICDYIRIEIVKLSAIFS